MYYSTDNKQTWTQYTTNNQAINVSAGNKVYFKNATPGIKVTGMGSFSASTGSYEVEGNIMSLLWGDDFRDKTELKASSETPIGNTFCHLFNYGDATAENKNALKSAENLILPSTTLITNCYGHMFEWCYGLTKAPELPATTLAYACYRSMFSYCTSLEKAPELPAETLVGECYSHMFTNSSNVNYVKCLAKDISASNCTSAWLPSTGSGTFVCPSSMENVWPRSFSGIPTGWTITTIDA